MYAVRTPSTTARGLALALAMIGAAVARPQSVQTTTVQGTVYRANGAPASGTLQYSWPAFTTAAGQAVAAGRSTSAIGSNGAVSIALAPNLGSWPAGLFYTVVYNLSDGSTSTEYWVVPNNGQATIAQVRSTVMPAAQAVQAVSKAYVDQSIQQVAQSQITPSGGTLTGPLYLSGDPSQPTQAADKRYVDVGIAGTFPILGGVLQGPVTAPKIGAVYQADQFAGSDFGARLQTCLNALDPNAGGTCDARNYSGSLSMASDLTVSAANATIYLPCATISTAASIVVPAGIRNVTLHGCASRGTSTASGTQGGTVLVYSGSSALLRVGDPTFAADTKGFHFDNAALNTTASSSAGAQAIALNRTQEISLSSLYVLGNSNQTALTLDGTGNYTGGTFEDLQITGYLTGVNAIGHTISNPAATDWLNGSTFVRLHVDCPTSSGNPIGGTTGINLLSGDGNTFTGGDIESCATALHLGSQAQNNTILGLRNENSTTQISADPGSSYNNWITGGTMFTGKLIDNGTRNSFLDTFHRSFNALNGDWYGSQQDATVTNHFRLGTGNGNERGLLDRYQTDYGYRWTTGLSDASAGSQYYQVFDELNNVYRLSIGQYNPGQSSANNQTALNAAGSGAVVLNGSNNSGTGGVIFGSGGPASSTVGSVDNSGNAHFTGSIAAPKLLQAADPAGGPSNALQSATQHYADTSQRINVASLGCVGDGVTDNYSCLAAMGANLSGKHYFFPAGTYLFNGCVTLADTATATGASWTSTWNSGTGTGTVTINMPNHFISNEQVSFTYPGGDPLQAAGLGFGPYSVGANSSQVVFTITSQLTPSSGITSVTGTGAPLFWQLEGSQMGSVILQQNQNNTCGFQIPKEFSNYWKITDFVFTYTTQQPAPASETVDAPSTFLLFDPDTSRGLGIAHFEIDKISCGNASRCFGLTNGITTATAWSGDGTTLTITAPNIYKANETVSPIYPGGDTLHAAGAGNTLLVKSATSTNFTVASTIVGSGTTTATFALANLVWNYTVHEVVSGSTVTGALINWYKAGSSGGNERCWLDNVFAKQTAKEPVLTITSCQELYFGNNESDAGADTVFDLSQSEGIVENPHIEGLVQTKAQTSIANLTAPVIQSSGAKIQYRNIDLWMTQCPATVTYSDGSSITPPCYTAGGAQMEALIVSRGQRGAIDIEGVVGTVYNCAFSNCTGVTLPTGVLYAADLASTGALWGGKVNGINVGTAQFTGTLVPGAADNSLVWLNNNITLTTPGTCTTGQYVSAISSSGALTCSAPATTPGTVVGSVDETGLTANALVASGLMYTLGSSPAQTYFQVCISTVLTTPATTSSTLPTPTVRWTDGETGTLITQSIILAQNVGTTNTIGTEVSGCGQIHALAGTAISAASGSYASSGATPMAYSLHGTVIALR